MELAEIKEEAKNILQGKRFNCVMVVITPFIFEFIYSLIFHNLIDGIGLLPLIIQFVNYVITIFLSLGCFSYFLKITRKEEVEYREVFSKGSLVIKALIISICILLVVFAGLLLLIIPGIILAFSYAMVEFIILDNPEIGIIESMTTSRKMMKGHRWEYFLLVINIVVVPLIISLVVTIFLGFLSTIMAITGTLLTVIFIIAFLIYLYTNIIPQLYLAISIFYNNLIESSKNNNVEESIENN